MQKIVYGQIERKNSAFVGELFERERIISGVRYRFMYTLKFTTLPYKNAEDAKYYLNRYCDKMGYTLKWGTPIN